MVRITEELVRKKAEHNEGIIGTLEELSLHQENIEKIEHLNNWCKDIQILYLQANLISKIENLNKLKRLEYLNLAINNIEKIENLERCEFLTKLDLTLNFVGDLESVCSLQNNIHLRHLYLTGNPCCDFPNYQQYVIAKLPQLETLDGNEIKKSDKIKAQQNLQSIEPLIKESQQQYLLQRTMQKKQMRISNREQLTDEEFWKSPSEHTPESRIEIAQRIAKSKKREELKDEIKINDRRIISLFTKNGRPLNINQTKLNFKLIDDDPDKIILNIEVYRYLDSALINVDIQPIYVKITVKGKIFQIVLPEEVEIDKCTAKRSQITGHLLIQMPRVQQSSILYKLKNTIKSEKNKQKKTQLEEKKDNYLGIMTNLTPDYTNIIDNEEQQTTLNNTDVPPLEYGQFC